MRAMIKDIDIWMKVTIITIFNKHEAQYDT